MVSHQKVNDILSIMTNAKKRISDTEMLQMLEIIREMSKDDLVLAYQILSINSVKGVDLSLFALMLTSFLKKAGVDIAKIPPLEPTKIAEITGIQPQSITINGQTFSIASVCADLGVRDREKVPLSGSVVGQYSKKIRHRHRNIAGAVTAALFTKRYGSLSFLSSLVIKLSPEDAEQYEIKGGELIISERSLKTSPENWAKLLRELEEVSSRRYNTPFLCVRNFFLSSLVRGNLFSNLKGNKVDKSETTNKARRKK